jgi:hypothetical protein
LTSLAETQEEADKIEREYHLGMMDPARLVAKIEKQMAIKKNVGTKKKVGDMIKQHENRHEEK